MALSKRTYVGGTTKITAANLNDIQDSIIALEGKGLTKEEVVDALEYTPAKASDIPTNDISANTEARHSHSNKDVLDNIAEITSISGGAVTGGANALVTKEVLDATSQLIMDEMPSELKNPYALTFTGASSGTYDGSSAVTINIPNGGGSSITIDSALSSTSTNPVQNKVIKSALDGKLSTSGGTLTGNLTGKYITGTWLQTTDATELASSATKIPVLDSQGWLYYRTLAHLKSDLGVPELSSSSITAALGYAPVQSSDIPTALKNPKALKFTGGATGTYDGSSELTINIPSGGGGSATGNELQYKGEWISSGNYQANDVVIDGSRKFYLYTGSSNGDPPDLDWENAKPFINETGSIAPGEAGFVCSGAIYGVFEYLLNTTTSDTGKFLRVNSAGKPAWESVPSGEGVNF